MAAHLEEPNLAEVMALVMNENTFPRESIFITVVCLLDILRQMQ